MRRHSEIWAENRKKSRKIILLCLGFLWFSSSLGPTCSSCWRQNNELDRPLIWISVIFHVFFIYPQLHLTNQISICCLIALFLAQSVYENTAFHIWIGIEPLIKTSHVYSCSIWYLGIFGLGLSGVFWILSISLVHSAAYLTYSQFCLCHYLSSVMVTLSWVSTRTTLPFWWSHWAHTSVKYYDLNIYCILLWYHSANKLFCAVVDLIVFKWLCLDSKQDNNGSNPSSGRVIYRCHSHLPMYLGNLLLDLDF